MNLETKATSGPWSYNTQYIIGGDGKAIAVYYREDQTNTSWRSREEGIANARIISVAPELLEAAKMGLKLCADLTWVEDDDQDQIGKTAKALKSAIAKVEGK